MSFPASFLLVITMMTATAAGAVAEVQTAKTQDAVHMAQLRAAAGRASSIGPAVLTLAADSDAAYMAQLRAAAGRASSIGPAVLTLAAN